MIDFINMIERRRSVRKFSAQIVTEEQIGKILKTALRAPSSKNSRSSSFMVVQTPNIIRKIAGMRDFGSAFLGEAPLVILVLGDETATDMWVINASISATYVQLAAETQGLGTCWVQVNGRLHDKEKPHDGTAEDYLKSFLSIPEGHRVLCAVAVGYPENDNREPREPACDEGKIIKV